MALPPPLPYIDVLRALPAMVGLNDGVPLLPLLPELEEEPPLLEPPMRNSQQPCPVTEAAASRGKHYVELRSSPSLPCYGLDLTVYL